MCDKMGRPVQNRRVSSAGLGKKTNALNTRETSATGNKPSTSPEHEDNFRGGLFDEVGPEDFDLALGRGDEFSPPC